MSSPMFANTIDSTMLVSPGWAVWGFDMSDPQYTVCSMTSATPIACATGNPVFERLNAIKNVRKIITILLAFIYNPSRLLSIIMSNYDRYLLEETKYVCKL